MKDRILLAIARQAPFLGALSAILMGAGIGFAMVGGVKGALGEEGASKAMWGLGVNSMLGSCLTLIVAVKTERYAARWRMR